MPETPTPGQVAYEAYERAYAETYRQWRERCVGEDHYGDGSAYAWHRQVAGVRAAWEAAAQAVREADFPGDWATHAPPLLYLLRVWRDQEQDPAQRQTLEQTIQALHAVGEAQDARAREEETR